VYVRCSRIKGWWAAALPAAEWSTTNVEGIEMRPHKRRAQVRIVLQKGLARETNVGHAAVLQM